MVVTFERVSNSNWSNDSSLLKKQEFKSELVLAWYYSEFLTLVNSKVNKHYFAQMWCTFKLMLVDIKTHALSKVAHIKAMLVYFWKSKSLKVN